MLLLGTLVFAPTGVTLVMVPDHHLSGIDGLAVPVPASPTTHRPVRRTSAMEPNTLSKIDLAPPHRYGTIHEASVQPAIERHGGGLRLTLKRDYVAVKPTPDAKTIMAQLPLWFDHYDNVHPHSALIY